MLLLRITLLRANGVGRRIEMLNNQTSKKLHQRAKKNRLIFLIS